MTTSIRICFLKNCFDAGIPDWRPLFVKKKWMSAAPRVFTNAARPAHVGLCRINSLRIITRRNGREYCPAPVWRVAQGNDGTQNVALLLWNTGM